MTSPPDPPPLPSTPTPLMFAPPSCPHCGGQMETGWLEGESNAGPASVLWTSQKSDQEDELAPIPIWSWSDSPAFPGFRCGSCKVIIIDYGTPKPHG